MEALRAEAEAWLVERGLPIDLGPAPVEQRPA
jgi:hypothetical protein